MMTRQQVVSLHRKWSQNANGMSYIAFRRSAFRGYSGEVMVRWGNMWLGIEPDGYTHS